ncbi:MAG: methyltransferase [Byssovorax sp.]
MTTATESRGSPVSDALSRALAIVIPALDIIEGRVERGAPPAWCEARGWTSFLLGLPDEIVLRCEAEGLAIGLADRSKVPPDLAALIEAVAAMSRLAPLGGPPRSLHAPSLRAVSTRKRDQLAVLLGAIAPMAEEAARIVDVGAGRGHLTRIAATLFDREAIGLEREASRVAAATALSAHPETRSTARFVVFDADREELALSPGDLALGLHACGALGDRLVLAAAETGCDLGLISCCFQKISDAERAPLSRAGRAAGLRLRKDALGLANLSVSPVGVEGPLAATMEAREARHALALLLQRRGLAVSPGEAMRGINRRRAHRGFYALAEQALALRGLAPATEDELAGCAREAAADFARVRRLSLPRALLARPTELALVLDRAAALEDAGLFAAVIELFAIGTTPRNLAIFASRSKDRLPR